MEKSISVRKKELWRSLKFLLFSCSAGVIQIASFTLLDLLVHWPEPLGSAEYGPNYFIALLLSVLWNFTFNRRFTFKSAANMPIAMLKVLGYYVVFTPLSIWWGVALTNGAGWNEYIVLFMTMVINFVTEFLFCRFVVYRNSIDTNTAAVKAQAEAASDATSETEAK